MALITLLIILRFFIIAVLYYHNNESIIVKSNKDKIQSSLEIVYNEFPDLRDDIVTLLEYKKNGYVVFIDTENDLDWETEDEYDDILESKVANKVLAQIDIIQNQPGIKYLSKENKKSVMCRLGRSLIQVLKNHDDLAGDMLNDATNFYNNRKAEITREWHLLMAITCFILVFMSIVFIELYCIYEVRYWSHCVIYSFMGVLLSIIYKTGGLRYDCGAGKTLNFLQILSKYIVGTISMLLLIGLCNEELIFHKTVNTSSENFLLALGIISGFSERLAPSIIEEISAKGEKML